MKSKEHEIIDCEITLERAWPSKTETGSWDLTFVYKDMHYHAVVNDDSVDSYHQARANALNLFRDILGNN